MDKSKKCIHQNNGCNHGDVCDGRGLYRPREDKQNDFENDYTLPKREYCHRCALSEEDLWQ